MSRHTCDALGCCQQRTPAFLGCEHHALAVSVQASRDTGCCGPLGTDDDYTDTTTRSESSFYWGCIGVASGLSFVAFFGTAGYLISKFA